MEGDREQGGYNGRGVREKDVGWEREREGGSESVKERDRAGESDGKQ